MRTITSKDGVLLSQFDNINEEIGAMDTATSSNIRSTSLYKMLIPNHVETNREKIKGQLPLEHISDFVKLSKK